MTSLLLLALPAELFIDILTYALYDHSNPANVLCVAQLFSTVRLRILHANIRLQTVRQLAQFSTPQESTGDSLRLACAPKTLSLSIPGGSASPDVFLLLAKALHRCKAALDELSLAVDESHPDRDGRVPPDILHLCLHSHMRINVQHIYDALILADPRTFIWTGPDPPHHFSIAITPEAVPQLFRVIGTWPHITPIKLANMSFPKEYGADVGSPTSTITAPLLPSIPSLRTLALDRTVFLPPGAIAAMICPLIPGQEQMDALELVHLVDTYRESIWGPRIRRGDIERATARASMISRVRRIVRCEAVTERLMGGDRVEGMAALE
ncbi:hypothetical protein C8Q72DRAFT_777841 [Fomitopsis betulina]|nr:hypothetical protein C8Q72DRAFT_777841 [Fomitopsis betulina]